MNAKGLIIQIRNAFSNARRNAPLSSTEQEQLLKDTNELLNKRTEENKALRKELKFIYDIFLHRKKCTFDIDFDSSSRLLLLTTTYEKGRKDIVTYIPREQLEIASISTHPSDDTLVIDDMSLNFIQCDTKAGKLVLEELIEKANRLGLSLIIGQFGETPGISFSEKRKFYQQIGFEAAVNAEEETGALLYRLVNDPA